MRARWRIAAGAALFAAAGATAGERPLATVDGEAITGADLESDFVSRHGGHMAFLAGEPEVRRALDGMIDRVLLLHEAERLELDTRPEVADAGADLARRLAVEHLLRTEISEPARPSEEEVRAAWEEHADELLEVRQIVVPARAEIDEIVARLAAGEPFEELARDRSTAASSREGGLLPPVRWGSLGAAWDEAVSGLAAGEVSEPFWNGEGWEVVELVERIPVERPELAEARELIQGVLLRANLERRRRELSRRLFDRHQAEVRLPLADPSAWLSVASVAPATPAATWSGGSLTVGALAEIADLQAIAALGGERAVRELEAAVRSAVNERLAAVEAEARGYLELPEVVDAVARYREEAMEAILHGEFIFRGIEVGDAEVEAWYAENGDEMSVPERRRVAQILTGSETEALAARRRLEAGEPFDELARELSGDRRSADRGGDLGWVTTRESPPGFEVVFTLPAGEVTEPLRTEIGWHLIQVADIEPARPRPLSEVADEVRRKLLREKRRAAREQWLEQLRAAAEIEIDEDALRAWAARSAG